VCACGRAAAEEEETGSSSVDDGGGNRRSREWWSREWRRLREFGMKSETPRDRLLFIGLKLSATVLN
jgi:hypothetical protein